MARALAFTPAIAWLPQSQLQYRYPSGVGSSSGSSSGSGSYAKSDWHQHAPARISIAVLCAAGASLRGRALPRPAQRRGLGLGGVGAEASEGEAPSVLTGFLRVAQPYFIPTSNSTGEPGEDLEDGGGNKWLGLVLALTTGVVSGTYWLALGAGSLAKVLVPGLLPPDVAGAIAALSSSQVFPELAGVGLIASLAVFWNSRAELQGRERQWCLLGLLLFLLFLVTGLNVGLSYVFRTIDNVLVSKDAAAFYTQLWTFGGTLVFAVPIIGSYRYTRLMLARDWRSFLTCFFLERYMSRRAYYELDSNAVAVAGSEGIDNPDQRMTEDIDSFTRETLGYLLDVLDSILNLISFATILWVTSKSLTVSLVVYALIGTAIAFLAGGKLIELNGAQLKREADLRYSLVHLRDNAEAIAFYGGEQRELRGVGQRLGGLLENISELIDWTTGLGIYQQAFFYLARLVPYLVIGGLYLSGEVDFGTLGQGTFAFSMVLESVTLIVSRIQDISRFSAGINRLSSFLEALKLPGQDDLSIPRISTALLSDGCLELQGVTVETPDGKRPLVENLDLKLGVDGSPKRLLVVGPSGVGKSSVLRAIAGLWTRGHGRVARPPSGSAMFLPQRPYMPLGDLRTQLLYPGDPGGASGEDSSEPLSDWQALASRWKVADADSTSAVPQASSDPSDEELHQALQSLGLGSLPERFEGGLDAVGDWSRTLSLGEQQRLAAARCLVRRPLLAVLDEATSALPVADEERLYEQLKSLGVSCLSVGHRMSLLKYHDAVLELQGGGKWRLLSPEAGSCRSCCCFCFKKNKILGFFFFFCSRCCRSCRLVFLYWLLFCVLLLLVIVVVVPIGYCCFC
ncbi:unnamed protein product [Polarella glacialis]|uniref:Uncharacterized protein n=1 Tax=Polarella glacialis TaxID=89957 RepID=A0A813HGI4_POLGL|nr:unnamed protein product [Polarella glacialis]